MYGCESWTIKRGEGEGEVAQSCLTLCDPVDCSPPGFSVHGILQARILEWVTISFSRGSSQPRDRTQVSRIGGRRFNLWAKSWVPKNWCFQIVVLEVPWTARRSNQSILKDINPEYSLEGLMLKLKLQYLGHLMWRAYSLKKTWCWERLKTKEGYSWRWDG